MCWPTILNPNAGESFSFPFLVLFFRLLQITFGNVTHNTRLLGERGEKHNQSPSFDREKHPKNKIK
jgi:hypothetical protein